MPDASEQMRQSLAMLRAARAPAHLWPRIEARVRNGDIVLLPLEDAAASRIRSPKFAAAAIVVLFASGAAAAVAFDAFRLLPRHRSGIEAPAQQGHPPMDAAPESANTPVTLLLDPDDAGRLRVEFARPGPDLQLRVMLTDAGSMELTTTGAAGAAQFRTGRGRIVITEAAAGAVTLEIPRTVVWLDVTVDGRVLLSKRGESVRLTVPADTSGAEFVLPVR